MEEEYSYTGSRGLRRTENGKRGYQARVHYYAKHDIIGMVLLFVALLAKRNTWIMGRH
jgi:hypothetical protein